LYAQPSNLLLIKDHGKEGCGCLTWTWNASHLLFWPYVQAEWVHTKMKQLSCFSNNTAFKIHKPEAIFGDPRINYNNNTFGCDG
jgi:hypothetical protein